MMKKLLLILFLICIKQLNAQCSLSISTEYNIICSSQTNLLIASSGATSYNWQPTSSIISTSITGDTVVVKPFTSTVYTLTATTGTCVATNTIAITVNNCTPPTVSFSENVNTTCVNHCIIFKDSTQYTSTRPLFYTWTFVGGSISPLSGSTVSFDTLHYSLTDTGKAPPIKVCYHISSLSNGSGYFPVIETVSNGLGQTGTVKDSVKIVPAPTINFNLVQDPAPKTWDAFFNYTTYGTNPTIIWYWGDGTSTNAMYPSHTYSAAGVYTISVSVTDNLSGCKDSVSQSLSTSVINVNVSNSATGINKIEDINNDITIYPNPSNGNFVIETNVATKQTLQVYDVNGRLVLTQTINGKTTIDVSNLPSSIYNVSIISNEDIVNKRIVISK